MHINCCGVHEKKEEKLDKNDFEVAGPNHLTRIVWSDLDHQRAVAAVLVEAVYLLYRDRNPPNDQPRTNVAPKWWTSLHFEIVSEFFEGDAPNTVFGAIFSYRPPCLAARHKQLAPRYVIAFRGTVNLFDVFLDAGVALGFIQSTELLRGAAQAALDFAKGEKRPRRLWVTGHSLGATVATFVSLRLVGSGGFYASPGKLQTFLFNPPLPAPMFVRDVPTAARVVLNALVDIATKVVESLLPSDGGGELVKDEHCRWVPNVYIHKGDWISKGFMAYFELEDVERARQRKLAAKESQEVDQEVVSLYFLPSAKLWVYDGPAVTLGNGEVIKNFEVAHGLAQWWEPGLQLIVKERVDERWEKTHG